MPGSRLLDAPFSSLPFCRWLDFPGQSRAGPGWALSAHPGLPAALQHTTHQGSEAAFPAALSATQGAGPAWKEPHSPCTEARGAGGRGPPRAPGCPHPGKPLRSQGWAPRSWTPREAHTQQWLSVTTWSWPCPDSSYPASVGREAWEVGLHSGRHPSQAHSCWTPGAGGLLQHKRDRSSLQSKWTGP